MGGAQVVVHNVALQQQAAGHQIALINRVTDRWGAYQQVKASVPYPVLPLMPKGLKMMQQASRLHINASFLLHWPLRYYQRKHQFEVWHLNLMGKTTLAALPYLKKMGVPLVGTCHGIDIQKLPEVGYGWRIDSQWEEDLRKALLQFDYLTAISDSVREEYLSLGIPPENIVDIPNGINYGYLSGLTVDKAAVKAQLGLPADKKIILTVGRNHPKKGYIYIPQVIRQLLQHRTDFLWVLVGAASEEIAELARKEGVENYFRAIPVIGLKKQAGQKYEFPSEDLIQVYKMADYFAFPTLIETFGNVTLEAMACGLPVVVTDSPGCRDIVTHGETGLLSPVKDPVAMANNLQYLMENKDIEKKLVYNGLKHACHYDWQRVSEKYLTCYQNAIQKAKDYNLH
jgi:glycosyltransferase involved in cell wall biosynthesis